MIMQLVAKSGESEVTIPSWLWASVGAVLLLIVGGLGTWVGFKLNSHDERFILHESRIAIAETQILSHTVTTNRIDNRIEKMDEKIDRVLERLGSN